MRFSTTFEKAFMPKLLKLASLGIAAPKTRDEATTIPDRKMHIFWLFLINLNLAFVAF